MPVKKIFALWEKSVKNVKRSKFFDKHGILTYPDRSGD
jgi:hypothetical protein